MAGRSEAAGVRHEYLGGAPACRGRAAMSSSVGQSRTPPTPCLVVRRAIPATSRPFATIFGCRRRPPMSADRPAPMLTPASRSLTNTCEPATSSGRGRRHRRASRRAPGARATRGPLGPGDRRLGSPCGAPGAPQPPLQRDQVLPPGGTRPSTSSWSRRVATRTSPSPTAASGSRRPTWQCCSSGTGDRTPCERRDSRAPTSGSTPAAAWSRPSMAGSGSSRQVQTREPPPTCGCRWCARTRTITDGAAARPVAGNTSLEGVWRLE